MKRKIFTLLLCVFLGNMAMAQGAEAVIKKAEVAPVVDGKMDAVWYGANTYNIAVSLKGEAPTLGPVGTTTWKGLWTDEGIYIFLTVNDDVWYPSYISGGNNWEYDKPELYFDVNELKIDGKGPLTDGSGGGNGHYQVAPASELAKIDGTPTTGTDGVVYSFLVADPTYSVEYFIPFSKLLDGNKVEVNKTAPIGFDVTIIDRDDVTPGRLRNDWSNTGSIDESWTTMDGCGTVTLSAEIAVPGNVVVKAATAPVIDGVVDPIWDSANTYNIVVPFKAEEATLGDPGQTTWKAMWDDKGMYILVQVADDIWFPFWAPGGGANGYEYDKVELYFDTNIPRKDGKGGQAATAGSIQIAPDSKESIIDGTMQTAKAFDIDYNYAIKVTDPTYVAEYFIPWDIVNDKNGIAFDKSTIMGFDVTVVDRDPGDAARKRVNWANAGAIDENWANMDDAGEILFEGATTVETINIESIAITGGQQITTDNGTLQFSAQVGPADATQKYKWKITNGTGKATISKDGLVTAILNGTVTVEAVSFDDFITSNAITVTISGQNVTISKINYLNNGNFDNTTATGGPVDWSTGTVTDGVLTFGPDAILTNQWDLNLLQTTFVPFALKDEDFVISFKAWADEPRTLPLVMEDAFNDGNQWDSYASSSDPNFSGKTWLVNLTTEPTIFTLDLKFSPMQETTIQNFNFQVGLSAAKIHLDSIYLVRKADLALVTSAHSLANAASKVQLYPNPVQTELTVSKIAVANSKVSVYNAVGQKLMEKTANGTQAKFDVANLHKGMYFVRFSDGTSGKFIKQ